MRSLGNSPGAMKSHTWARIKGDETKMLAIKAIFSAIQNTSPGATAMSFVGLGRYVGNTKGYVVLTVSTRVSGTFIQRSRYSQYWKQTRKAMNNTTTV